jgi:hypothetical protein
MTREKYTVWRSIRHAIIWLVVLLLIPLVAGMVYQAALMIQQGTTHPVDPTPTTQIRR